LEAFATDAKLTKKIKIGERVQMNDYVHISAIESVTIGNDVLIASHVYISDNSHGSYKGDASDTSPYICPVNRPYLVAPVKISDRVWIGEGVIIMPGVTIGEGCVIGAHSIVSKSLPPNTISVGVPAKPIKMWDNNINRWVKI
jgi:lipopolysaccharide O-acetyltransferase